MRLDPIISARELVASPHVVLFDCRTGPNARASYELGHLPGARFVDLETELSEKSSDAARGGRHPLPPLEVFAARLGAWGVTPRSHVVAYDDQNGANAAARLWWMLHALGHEAVQVLDGGLAAAVAEGMPLVHEPASIEAAPPYPARSWHDRTVDIDQVERVRTEASHRVLDVRAAPRYRGESEPIDPIAGHIPGAHNIPLTENLRDDRFKTAEELRALYAPWLGALPPEKLIVHCGSGVTACHTLLALERAGLSGAKLYVGSWSEWCRNPERPREP